MKNLFMLIALLTMHSTLSQSISTTKEQKERVFKVFTAEKIIDISKGLSNEQKQDSVITIRDKQIKELQLKITSLQEEHKNTLIEIAKENKVAETSTQQIDSISDYQLSKEKAKWQGLHLYGGTETPKLKAKNTIINAELMYELKKVEFGFKVELEPTTVGIGSEYTFNCFLKLRYKLF